MKLTSYVKTVACFSACFFMFHSTANAQSSFLQNFSRYQRRKTKGKSVNSYLSYNLGYALAFNSADFSHSFTAIDAEGNVLGNRIINRHFDNVRGIGGEASGYAPLFDVADKSKVAFSYGVSLSIFQYDLGQIHLNEVSTYDYDLKVGVIAIPLCLDYKYGGEADFDKTEHFSFTAGVGLSPSVFMTNFGPMQAAKLTLRPYVHASIGIFGGVEWKINVSYLPGETKCMNLGPDKVDVGYESTVTMTSHSVFQVGISVMPFSFGWKKGNW